MGPALGILLGLGGGDPRVSASGNSAWAGQQRPRLVYIPQLKAKSKVMLKISVSVSLLHRLPPDHVRKY